MTSKGCETCQHIKGATAEQAVCPTSALVSLDGSRLSRHTPERTEWRSRAISTIYGNPPSLTAMTPTARATPVAVFIAWRTLTPHLSSLSIIYLLVALIDSRSSLPVQWGRQSSRLSTTSAPPLSSSSPQTYPVTNHHPLSLGSNPVTWPGAPDSPQRANASLHKQFPRLFSELLGKGGLPPYSDLVPSRSQVVRAVPGLYAVLPSWVVRQSFKRNYSFFVLMTCMITCTRPLGCAPLPPRILPF
ncbi:hypothetical protein DL93DRAFT_1263755 [Clavulina sp. PMI_390]|nr:hypothetical protein DL93DRAFT_1263755 [Clavulina sp. PMI_390]